ncbi:MAG: HD domain-containing protein [Paludibacter sp.]|nr:HD domain-containing protein [Paludibacter sp.]
MTERQIIDATVDFVKNSLAKAEGGHDWWHIYRVWQLAKKINENEKGSQIIVELAALLHDIADSKFYEGDEKIGPRKAEMFLQELKVDYSVKEHVVSIIRNISFKGGNEQRTFSSRELDIVQDADRLDAIGAIGIARTFNYGGFKNRSLYDPAIKPNLTMTKEEYKNSTAPTINHFYEKLLLLKDRMNTTTGKKLAEDRHRFMELFLEEFYKEWNGIK